MKRKGTLSVFSVVCIAVIVLIAYRYHSANAKFHHFDIIDYKLQANQRVHYSAGDIRVGTPKIYHGDHEDHIQIPIELSYAQHGQNKHYNDLDSQMYVVGSNFFSTETDDFKQEGKRVVPNSDYFKRHQSYKGQVTFSVPKGWLEEDDAYFVFVDEQAQKKTKYMLKVN